jgi:hypothetical protein
MVYIFSFSIKTILSLSSFTVDLLVLQVVEGEQSKLGTKQDRTTIMWEESIVE